MPPITAAPPMTRERSAILEPITFPKERLGEPSIAALMPTKSSGRLVAKARTKEVLTYYGINTPKFCVVVHPEDINFFKLSFPVIIKPIGEGSSKGIFNSTLVPSLNELRLFVENNLAKYKQP